MSQSEERERWLEDALAQSGYAALGSHLRLLDTASLLCAQGKLARARPLYQESLALIPPGDDEDTEVVRGPGSHRAAEANFDLARCYHAEALSRFKSSGQGSGVTRSMIDLGEAALYRAEFAEVRSRNQQSITRFQKVEDDQDIVEFSDCSRPGYDVPSE